MLSEKEVAAWVRAGIRWHNLFGQQAPEYKVDETLRGKVLDIGDWQLEVMETQGTPQGACVFMREMRRCSLRRYRIPGTGTSRTDMFGGSTEELVVPSKADRTGCKDHYPGHMDITSQNVNRQIQI